AHQDHGCARHHRALHLAHSFHGRPNRGSGCNDPPRPAGAVRRSREPDRTSRQTFLRFGRSAQYRGLALAAVAAILKAVARTVGRDLRSLDAVHGNNFFWIIMLMAYQQPSSAIFLGLILAVLLILPFSAEPLRKIPPDRLALWPLTRAQRFTLRAGSLALSPIFWIAAALFIWTAQPGPAAVVILLAVGVQVIATILKRVAVRLSSRNLPRLIPRF